MKMLQQQLVTSLWLSAWFVAQCAGQDLPFKAVNLGGWLVIEGWMTPSLFDAIPNKDLLDGTQVHLKSVKLKKYMFVQKMVVVHPWWLTVKLLKTGKLSGYGESMRPPSI